MTVNDELHSHSTIKVELEHYIFSQPYKKKKLKQFLNPSLKPEPKTVNVKGREY